MKVALLACGMALLLLSGCDVAPSYHVPVVTTPASFEEMQAWSPAHPLDAAPRGAWWRVFGDRELDALEARLDGANPSLDAAQASFEQARAFAAEAEAGLYPQLSIGGRITTNRQSERRPLRSRNQPNQYLDNAIDTQASYEIDFWDKAANAIRAGRAAAQASAADIATLRLSLHAELASDYMTLAGLDAQAGLLAQTVRTYQRALTLTQNRLAGLIASGMDVSRAATQLDNARAQAADVGARRALVEHGIAVLVGVPPSSLAISVRQGQELAVPAVAAGLPATLLQRRPDIAAAERQMFAANAEIGVTKAAFYPNVSLNAVLGLQDTGFNMFNLPDSFWTVGPGVTLPLFEGGLRHAEVNAATAAYRQAAANYKGTVLDAFADVEDELSQLRLLGEEQHDETAAAADANSTLRSAAALYEQGADSYLEVVTAQTAALDAQRAALDLNTRRLQASVALIRALGGGWSSADLPDLSGKARKHVGP